MKDAERLRLRQLHAMVRAHTEDARAKFQVPLEERDPGFWMMVLFEEAGKLARTYLKLSIVPAGSDAVARHWREERDHRIVVCLSILERLWLHTRRGP